MATVIDLLGTFSARPRRLLEGTTARSNGNKFFLDWETFNATYNVSAASGTSPSGLMAFNATPVPEASSIVSLGLLLLLGLGGTAVSRRRKAGVAH